MWVFGGYKFDTPINAHTSSSGSGIEIEGRSDSAQFLRYNIESDTWEILRADGAWPRPRHAHSAIVYKDSMYVFGGSILPDERITDELWKFDFGTLKWYEIDTRTNRSESLYYPIAVKHHTSAVVDDKMLILFGYSYFDSLLNYVQEFDLVNETWLSSPPQYGKIPSGRMGHTSVYIPELQLIFVYGGFLSGNQGHHISTLLSYDPHNFHWSDVSSSHVGLAFHTTVLMGGALVIVGGTSSADCFYNYTLIYDLILDEWRELRDVPGFHGNVGRYGHSSVSLSDGNMLVFGGFKGQVYSQLLTLNKANCSSLTNDSCLSSLCYWSEDDATCSDITLDPYRSKTLSCHLYSTCTTCNQLTSCLWSNTTNHCTYNSSLSSSITNCTSPSLDDDCSNYDQCQTCSTHNHCHWSSNKCSLLSPSDNVTMETCPPSSADNRCSSMTTCSSCIHGATNCLWCPSLSQCVPSALYPHSFIYGQCLAWTTSCKTASCEDQLTCDNCTGLAGCGWCRDPANTGLGSCIPGGFTESLNATSCTNNHWFFDTCPRKLLNTLHLILQVQIYHKIMIIVYWFI
jgi:Fanconi anemia group I protein